MSGGYTGMGGAGDPRVKDVDPNSTTWGRISSDIGYAKDGIVWAATNPKKVGMWLVDNGLYNTKESWYSTENLLNIGTLGVSVVAGAFSAGTGTGAVLGARMALGATVKTASRVALKETVEDFAVKPAAKAALRAGVVEPLATAPLMGAIGALGSEEQEPLTKEKFQTELDGLSNFYQEQITPATPKAPEVDAVAQNNAATIDPIRKAFMDTFNSVAGMLGLFVPKQAVGLLAGAAAAFVIATSGDGDDRTSKMDELSGLTNVFMEVAFGAKPDTTAPAYTTEPKTTAPAPALVG